VRIAWYTLCFGYIQGWARMFFFKFLHPPAGENLLLYWGDNPFVLGRDFLYYRDNFCTGERLFVLQRSLLYWGENLCTTEIIFCTGERLCVLRRSLSVLRRSLSVLGRDFLYYRDHFLYWGESLCTTEITFCTGERLFVLQKSLSGEFVYYTNLSWALSKSELGAVASRGGARRFL